MSPVGEPAPGATFLVALLRRGAPVIAVTPRDLPSDLDDPSLVPGARRITAIAGTDMAGPSNPLLVRATTYVVLLPLAYRIFLTPVIGLLVVAQGPSRVWSAGLVTLLAVLSNVAAAVWLLRVPERQESVTRLLLYADIVFALGANLLVSATVPGELYAGATWVTWGYLTGTVALWTVSRGVVAGLWLVVVGVPLQGVMLWDSNVGAIGGPEVTSIVVSTAILLVAVVTAMGALMLVGLGTRLALAIGIRQGKAVERARFDRATHDTVLQALEVMAMTTTADVTDPHAELARLRGAARAQADEVRRGLEMPHDGTSPDGLGAELATLAGEMARDGLRAQLVIADIDDDVLSEVRRIAIRDATREAFRNTIKHAGTGAVVVRLEERDGGIAVIARDHGIGYDAGERPPGFGVSNSMKARLAEVGGHCHIESWPSRGTRVTLWVPR